MIKQNDHLAAFYGLFVAWINLAAFVDIGQNE